MRRREQPSLRAGAAQSAHRGGGCARDQCVAPGTTAAPSTFALHIRSSEFVGYNEYGHAQFESTRTELGELLYRLKYKGDQPAIAPIAQARLTSSAGGTRASM